MTRHRTSRERITVLLSVRFENFQTMNVVLPDSCEFILELCEFINWLNNTLVKRESVN